MRLTALTLLLFLQVGAVDLKPETVEAFEKYISQTEQRLSARKTFLWADESADRVKKVRNGAIVVQPAGAKSEVAVPHGLVHDWVGSVFIPGVTVERTVAFVQDYDRHKQYYKPEVVDSRTLSRNGNDFRIFYRLLKKKVITVVLNTEHEVKYTEVDPKRWRSFSQTTKIAEVENPGKPNERELPPGAGQGFLWKLDSFWRFEERDGGTWVECQAVSLTRDIPTGLGWLINPIVSSLPKESLENTLRSTRTALAK
jgi:hypothetical protein